MAAVHADPDIQPLTDQLLERYGPVPGGPHPAVGVMETEPVFKLKSAVSSPPAGYRFPREVIAAAVRWYLRYGLSYRDVEELLAERGIEVDHVTVYRWVQTFTSEFIDAARPARHCAGDRWFVDETYVKIAGRWTYLYRAIDQHGQVIDVLVSIRRDGAAARAFFTRALRHGLAPAEVTTDRAPVYRPPSRAATVQAVGVARWTRAPVAGLVAARRHRSRLSATCVAAVDGQADAGDHGGFVAEEEGDRPGDVVLGGPAAQGHLLEERVLDGGATPVPG